MNETPNTWQEWAIYTSERLEQAKKQAAETTKSLTDAMLSGNEMAAKTWRLLLEAETMFVRELERRLEREREQAAMADSTIGQKREEVIL